MRSGGWRARWSTGAPTARGSGTIRRRRPGVPPPGDHRPARALQPAAAPRATLHLVFNGEIYNYVELREELRGLGHSFVTEGDGEVLLHAWAEWGEDGARPPQRHVRVRGLGRGRRIADPAVGPLRREAAVLRASCAAGSSSPPTCGRCRAADPAIGRRDPSATERVPGARHDARSARDASSPTSSGCPPRTCCTGRRRTVEDAPLVAAGPVEVPGARRASRGCASCCPTRSRLRLRSDVPVGTSLSGGVDSSAIVAICAASRGGRSPSRVHRHVPRL